MPASQTFHRKQRDCESDSEFVVNMMHIKLLLALLPCLISISASQSFFLPNLVGPYPVGTIALELIDQATNRDIMTSFFYPTSPHSLASYPLSPDFPPKLQS